MDRITEEVDGFYELKPEAEVYGWENGIRLVQIVGRLEDLEDQIGCTLSIREKALQQGFIYNGFTKISNIYCKYNDNECFLSNGAIKFYIKDYKKTWWLKEDKSE